MQLCKVPNNLNVFVWSIFFNLMYELSHYYNFFFESIFEKYYSLENINLNH